MKETLLENGFEDKGACGSCGGAAWRYLKQVGGKLVEVKTYGKYENSLSGRKWVDNGTAMIKVGNSLTRVSREQDLQNILNVLGIAKVSA